MIRYANSIKDITPEMLEGFFAGWLKPPSLQKRLQTLANSDYLILALDDSNANVIGFITAISDGLCAYLPLLEVLPEYRGQGIGKELVHRMFAILKEHDAIYLSCDKELQPFYTACGMTPISGMIRRNDV